MNVSQMPPLAELSVNLLTRNGDGLQRSVPQGEVQDLATTFDNDHSKLTHKTASPSIQNMLKTTTEIGHIGQLPIKPARKPQSTFKSRIEDKYGGSPMTRRHQPTGEGLRTTKEKNIRNHPTPLEATASRFSPGLRNQPGRFYQHELDDRDIREDRPWPIAQSPHTNYSYANRRPNSNQGYQTRLIGPGGRPRSPFAYPTRLKRPGYRPSSPASSDIQYSVHSSSFSSRPASPASLHSTKQSLIPWQQHINYSDPMLRHYASAHWNGSPNNPPAIRQPSTPQPTPSLHNVGSSSRMPQHQTSMTNMWDHNESPLTTPLFYDYSEDFEESRQPSRNIETVTMPCEPDDQHPIVYANSQSDPASPKDQPIQDLAENDRAQSVLETFKSKADLLGSIPTRKSIAVSPGTELDQTALTAALTKRFTTGTIISKDKAEQLVGEKLNASHSSPTIATNQNRAESTDSRQERETNSPFSFISSEKKAKIKSSKIINCDNQGRSFSLEDSVSAAGSTSYLERNVDESNSVSPSSALTAQAKKPPSKSKDLESEASYPQNLQQGPTFESHSVSEPTEIISPTPERSILSPNSHRRFSKILGLEESETEIEATTQEALGKENQIVEVGYETLLPFRDSLANNDTVNTSILQFSESDGENGFTPSLMQTFGQGLEQRTAKDSLAHAGRILNNQDDNPDNVLRQIESISPVSQTLRTSSFSTPASLPFKQDTNGKEVHDDQTTKNRHAQIITSHSKPILRVDKELPLVPEERRCFVSVTPPRTEDYADLPFSFAPLVQVGPENEAVAESGAIFSRQPQTDSQENDLKPPSLFTKKASDRNSTASSHGSRPWNNEASYPWADELPDLEVALPQSLESTLRPSRFPRFKLRIQRASTSSAGTGRLTKCRASSDGTMSSRRSSALGPAQTPVYKHKSKPKLPIAPGQVNSSRDIGDETFHTRFVESFNLPLQQNAEIISPSVALLPPSPGHEARSFFSDDSSQARPKGSLRKRLSDFRARHSQVNVADETRGYDRGLLGSTLGKSRASGRTSRQSQNTAGARSTGSQQKRGRSGVLRKVRFWWNRTYSRFRHWSWRVRHHGPGRLTQHVDLYPGT